MPLRIPIPKTLSDLIIDADKGWAGKNITNLGDGAFDLNAKLSAVLDADDIQFITGYLHTGAEHSEGGALEITDALDIDALTKLIHALYESRYIWWSNSHWLPSNLLGKNVSGSGTVIASTSSLQLATEDTINSYIGVYKATTGGHGWASPSWNKARRFKALVQFYSTSNTIAHVATGGLTSTEENIEPHVGFKLKLDRCLYATVGNNSAETEMLISGPHYSSFYVVLEVVFTPGVEARFYVNNVDEGTIETNLPTGSGDAAWLFNARIANVTTSNRRMYLYHVRMLQEP